jgi:OOP family OmpA-OmpF porin
MPVIGREVVAAKPRKGMPPMRTVRILSSLAAFAVILAPALALAEATPKDAPGTRDHPMFKRYENSWILGYEAKAFSDFKLPVGPIKRIDEPGGGVRWEPERVTRLEGRHTRILYVVPVERATLEVLRNYTNEFERLGYKTLFACAAEECGADDGKTMVTRVLYPLGNKLKNGGQMSEYALNFVAEARYVAAVLERPEGSVYVSLFVAKDTFSGFADTKNKVMVLLDVVEVGKMEERMVDPKAEDMKKGLDRDGKVALYGILFDFNKTEIKPESTTTLGEVANLLQANPGLKLYVVGHTDAVGAMAYNKDLSEKRAVSVVQWLVAKHRIAGDRLVPAGVGPLAPVATNATEEGRAKNRRVELVVRP